VTSKHESKQSTDSTTKVSYPQSVFSGVRRTKGFKCDTGLYKEFKLAAKAKMGSVCRPLECFMVAFLALNKQRVNFGTTVTIENLAVQRNLRSRRRLVVPLDDSVKAADSAGVAESVCDFCGKSPVVGFFQNRKVGVWKRVCAYHAEDMRQSPKWVEVDSNDG